MSSNSNQSKSGGITFAGALGLLFIGLKLGHAIDWPWIWVLAPLWVGLAIALALIVVFSVVIGVATTLKRGRR